MNLKELFPLMYCVNLDNRPDRWKLAQEEFEKINVNPTRFSAIYDVNKSWRGCRASHLAILKEAKRQDTNVFIFEDDVEFIDKSGVEESLEELSSGEWDMFYLGGNILKPFYQISTHLARLQYCQSTHAYGVNRNFLDAIITFIELYPNMIIDVMYANIVIPNYRAFISVPMHAIQRESYSDIEKRNMTYSLPIDRYNSFLRTLDK